MQAYATRGGVGSRGTGLADEVRLAGIASGEEVVVAEAGVGVVFVAAMVTAIATGLGALPFLFIRTLAVKWVSLANAMAAGLMLAATHALVGEGIAIDPVRLIIGILLGLAGILAAQRWIDDKEHFEFANLAGLDARKAFLIVAVMTAHSFAEGVGVGVAFGGTAEFATFVTLAIAVHNIPEGLAIALVLIPRGTPVWQAALWGFFSSLPQPLAAVPSYLAVAAFEPLLPVGLGFAAGAMMWMVFSELIPDANKDAKPSAVGIVVTLSFAAMIAFQFILLKD